MQFDTNNKVVKLCSEGMELEGHGRKKEAFKLFQQAWDESSTDFEKFTSAHYVARHQENVQDKLKWDEIALNLALKINDENVKGALPSLYLNIAKCHEELNDLQNARLNYNLALSYSNLLPEDGYGNMIKGGIKNGIERLNQKNLKMRKVIAAINMTLDGVCDHTVGVVDEGLHQHYTELIDNAGIILYGRTTYQLMQFWKTLFDNPSGKKSMDDFAVSINNIPKLVFSSTLQDTSWDTAKLSDIPLTEKVLELKQQSGNDILIGSRSLIIQLLNNNLIDEFQICVHPIIEGKGIKLFDHITDRIMLKLINAKILNSGATIFYYEPTSEETTNR
jgi:dihydrofolate reductase